MFFFTKTSLLDWLFLRKIVWVLAIILLMGPPDMGLADTVEEDLTFFRIGTGATLDGQYGLAVAISAGISSPPDSPACKADLPCAVPGLIAVAQSRENSFDNILALRKGEIESALVHSNMAYWASKGLEQYAFSGQMENLRVIANLTAVSIHIIVSAKGNIEEIRQLRGRKLAIGPVGSGTELNANIILQSFGLADAGIATLNMPTGEAMDALEKGTIDAMVMIGSAPMVALTDFAKRHPIRLLPLDGASLQNVTQRFPFAEIGTLPAGLYGNNNPTQTLRMRIAWVVRNDSDIVLIESITRALWQGRTADFYSNRHPQWYFPTAREGSQFQGVLFHEGALRYYRSMKLTPYQ